MVIDAHVHITKDGKWFHTNNDASLSRLLREMDQAKVDKAVLLALDSFIENDFIAKVVKQYPDRFWGIGSVNPDNPRAIEEIMRCREDLGLVGLKLHPRLSGWDFSTPNLLPALAKAGEQRMVVVIDSFLYSRSHVPRRPIYDEIAQIAVELPTLQIIVAHAGFHEVLETSLIARVFDNIWLDFSFVVERFWGSSVQLDLQYACATLSHKIVWGSDFPEINIENYFLKCKMLWKDLTAEQKQAIVGENWLSLMRRQGE